MSILSQFKLKDWATALNLFFSFWAVILVLEGRFALASGLVCFNIMVLDVVDGVIARVTKSGNAFGKHFDSVVDFVGSSVIICFFVYAYLSKVWHGYWVVVFSFLPLLVGVLREVNSRMDTTAVKGYFIGFPRNSGAMVIIALLNSSQFYKPWFYPVALALYIGAHYLQLSRIPFVGNDKSTLLKMPRMKIYLSLGLILIGVMTALGYFWDSMLIIMLAFIISPFVIVDKAVWQNIKAQKQTALSYS